MGLCVNGAKFCFSCWFLQMIMQESQMVGWLVKVSCRTTNVSPPNGRISQRTRSYVQRGVNPEKIGESSCHWKGPVWNHMKCKCYDNFIWYIYYHIQNMFSFQSLNQIDSIKQVVRLILIYLVSNVWGYSAEFCSIVTLQFSCLFFLSKFFSLDQLKNFLPIHDPISPFTQSIRGLIWIKIHKQLIDLATCSMEYSYGCS